MYFCGVLLSLSFTSVMFFVLVPIAVQGHSFSLLHGIQYFCIYIKHFIPLLMEIDFVSVSC